MHSVGPGDYILSNDPEDVIELPSKNEFRGPSPARWPGWVRSALEWRPLTQAGPFKDPLHHLKMLLVKVGSLSAAAIDSRGQPLLWSWRRPGRSWRRSSGPAVGGGWDDPEPFWSIRALEKMYYGLRSSGLKGEFLMWIICDHIKWLWGTLFYSSHVLPRKCSDNCCPHKCSKDSFDTCNYLVDPWCQFIFSISRSDRGNDAKVRTFHKIAQWLWQSAGR